MNHQYDARQFVNRGAKCWTRSLMRAGCGAAAGLAGPAAMHAFRALWRRATGGQPEFDLFGLDRESDVNSVQMLAHLLRRPHVEAATAEALATVLHYLFGASAGALYGSLAEAAPVLRAGFGTLYGTSIWVFGDELPIRLAGVCDVRRKSAVSHCAALFAHLLFGATVELLVPRGPSKRSPSRERVSY